MTRHSNLQRKRMWALLSMVSDKARFKGYQLSKDEWKDIFCTHLYGKRGMSTREFEVGQMADFQNYIEAFCIDNNINLKE